MIMQLVRYLPGIIIVFVWSQYDGVNIEQWTKGYGWCKNQEAKLKIVGGVMPQSNQQEAYPTISNNICNCVITFSIVLTSK